MRTAQEEKTAQSDRQAVLLDFSPAVIYSFEAEGSYNPTFVSDNLHRVFGYFPNQYLDNSDFWRTRVHVDDIEIVNREFTKLVSTGYLDIEYRFRKSDGSYIWVHDSMRLLAARNGKPKEIVGSWLDIDQRKHAQQQVIDARDRLEHLVASSPAVIYSYSASGPKEPTFVSANIARVLGYERWEYLSNADFWKNQVHPDDLSLVIVGQIRLFTAGSQSIEYRFRKKNGAYIWVHDEMRVIFDKGGSAIEVVGAWSDVTSRHQLIDALKAALGPTFQFKMQDQ